ncbi:MAG: thymidine phosphorylase [Alphaproteobacteria bacterium]
MILPQEIIRKKRDGEELSTKDIEQFIEGIKDWSISDGQIAAFAMAIVINGMTNDETVAMINAVVDTGMVIDWSTVDLNGPVVDGHTTGGVGDKTDILYAPILAACGAHVPMISGHGLHYTGGTLDKMESIVNYNSVPETSKFKETVKNAGCAIIGATPNLISVDRRIYPIRDITATINSVPLITTSIISKKIAAGIKDGLVFDVKNGNGTFTATLEETTELAKSLVINANKIGLPTAAIISDMNQVMGHNAGNALEILECIEFLTGKRREARLQEIVTAACAEALVVSKLALNIDEAKAKIGEVLDNGKAAEAFAKMVASLGGDSNIIEKPEDKLPKAKYSKAIYPKEAGIVTSMNTRWFGLSVVHLGGGRLYLSQKLDYAAGFSEIAAVGERVDDNRPLAIAHAETEEACEMAVTHIRGAVNIGEEQIKTTPPIYQKITADDVK